MLIDNGIKLPCFMKDLIANSCIGWFTFVLKKRFIILKKNQVYVFAYIFYTY